MNKVSIYLSLSISHLQTHIYLMVGNFTRTDQQKQKSHANALNNNGANSWQVQKNILHLQKEHLLKDIFTTTFQPFPDNVHCAMLFFWDTIILLF